MSRRKVLMTLFCLFLLAVISLPGCSGDDGTVILLPPATTPPAVNQETASPTATQPANPTGAPTATTAQPTETPSEDLKDWPYNLPIYDAVRTDKKLCLSINCAWGADDIDEILDILDDYQVKTTFFIVGKWAELYPEQAKAIYARGHEIGSHSYNHVLPSNATSEAVYNDTKKGKEALEKVIGVTPKYFRAPSGDYTPESLDFAYSLGMIPVQWSADSVDWDDTRTEEQMLERIRKDTADGGIILFHNDTKLVLTVLPKVLKEYQDKGFTFVKISELLYADNYTVNTWGHQIKQA